MENMMKITRTSLMSGITRTMDLPVSEADYAKWKSGVLIQKAMPYLTAGQREFIMTGITDEEWEDMWDGR
jgi:hypothetical protein